MSENPHYEKLKQLKANVQDLKQSKDRFIEALKNMKTKLQYINDNMNTNEAVGKELSDIINELNQSLQNFPKNSS